jgi:hypothetical protein
MLVLVINGMSIKKSNDCFLVLHTVHIYKMGFMI